MTEKPKTQTKDEIAFDLIQHNSTGCSVGIASHLISSHSPQEAMYISIQVLTTVVATTKHTAPLRQILDQLHKAVDQMVLDKRAKLDEAGVEF